MEKRQIKSRIPDNIASSLWSYNIQDLDIKKDRRIIITQILNFGDPDRIKWLHSVYSDGDIKEVVLDPLRGRWFEKVLNFWEIILEIKIPGLNAFGCIDLWKKYNINQGTKKWQNL